MQSFLTGVTALLLGVFPAALPAQEEAAGGFDISLSFDVDALPDPSGQPVPVAGGPAAIAVTGRIALDDDAVSIESLKVLAPGSEMEAHGRLATGTIRPRLELTVASPRLDFSPFMPPAPESYRRELLFSATPLPVALLHSLDGRVDIAIRELVMPVAVLRDLNLQLRLADAVLASEGARAELANGRLEAGFVIAATATPDRVRAGLRLRALGIEPSLLPHAEGAAWIEGLRTDFEIEGSGSGASIAALMAGADGRLYLRSGPGRVPDSYVDLIGANLFWDVFRRLTPFGGDIARLDCSVIHFAVRDGIATTQRGIVLQSAERTLVGSGEIDLQSETMNLGLKTWQADGDSGNLARIEGTLAHPEIKIDAAAKFGAGVAAGAAIATGGLSLLARELFAPAQADPEPCRTATGQAQ